MVSTGGGADESPDTRAKTFDEGVTFSAQATERLLVCGGPYLATASYGGGESLVQRVLLLETETDKKRACMEKAVEITRNGLRWASHTPLSGVQHTLSKALYFLATTETDSERKRALLKEALAIRMENTEADERLLPPDHWFIGRAFNYSALIKAELSEMEQDVGKKTEALQSAVSDMKKCLSLSSDYGKGNFFASQVALFHEWYGDILLRLFRLTQDSETARSAAENYHEAISFTTESGQLGPAGPLRWKLARTYDTLGDFEEASEPFRLAGEDYARGAGKIRGLAMVYSELASYMGSWALIEKARTYHDKEDYSAASVNYR